MIEAGIFDIGGVLTQPSSFRELHELLVREFAIEQVVFDEAWKELYPQFGKGKIQEGEFWTQLQAKTGFTAPLPAADYLEKEYEKIHSRMEDTYGVVQQLRDQGIKTAILSNMIPPHTRYNRSSGIVDNFDVVIFSDEVGFRKPEPEIFHLVLNELQVEPEQAFFVDDQQKNITGAEAIGIHGILYQDGDHLRAELRKLGVEII